MDTNNNADSFTGSLEEENELDNLQAQLTDEDLKSELVKRRIEKLRVDTQYRELKRGLLSREYIKSDAVLDYLNKLAGALKTQLERIPAKISQKNPTLSVAALDEIEEVLTDTLNAISKIELPETAEIKEST